MNRKQWHVLSIASFLLGLFLMYISLQWKGSCDMFGEATMSNIFSCIRGEIFAPYPYIFFASGIIFSVLAGLEPKKK